MTEQDARVLLAEECKKQGLGGTRLLDRRALVLFDKTVAAAIAAIMRAANSETQERVPGCANTLSSRVVPDGGRTGTQNFK